MVSLLKDGVIGPLLQIILLLSELSIFIHAFQLVAHNYLLNWLETSENHIRSSVCQHFL